MTLAIPTVHLNGTSSGALRVQLKAQAAAIRVAIETLCANGPHGRDYYTQGPEAYENARRQHEARIEALREIYRELGTIIEGVLDQVSERTREALS